MTDSVPVPVRRLPAFLLAATLTIAANPALAKSSSAGTFSLELNRLDAVADDCRVTLVEKNGTQSAFATLKLDLVVFDGADIVTKRVGVDAGPLKAGRTVVKTFDLKGLACDGVGRLLINDVLACEAEGIAADACLDLVEPRSRVAAPFDK